MTALIRKGPFVLVSLVTSLGCTSIEGGNRGPATIACLDLCDAQAGGEGCSSAMHQTCDATCIADTNLFTERCLLAARAYYECSLQVGWACPAAPDRPETEDARCAAEERVYLACKITGDPGDSADGG